MNLDEYKAKFSADEATPGWDCIDQKLEEIYGDFEPDHFAAMPHYALGGENPLDGVSVYPSDAGGIPHKHIVTYGFSQLYYDEEAAGREYSKFGFELTFRPQVADAGEEVHWAVNMLQNVAKYVFNTGNYFDDYHYMPANGPIRLEYDTKIHAMAFLTDPQLGAIDTPHGKVQFLQVIGLTQQEYESVRKSQERLKEILAQLEVDNPMLVTDLDREEIE